MPNRFSIVSLALSLTLFAQDKPDKSYDFTLNGDKQWFDTNIDVSAGDLLKFTATGKISYPMQPNAKDIGPAGGARGWLDMVRNYPVNDANKGAVVGKIGTRDTSRGFMIGDAREQRVTLDGRLFVGINQMSNEAATGAFTVHVDRFAGKAMVKADTNSITKLTQSQLDSIPKRVVDSEGNPGDRVNFIIIGSEQQVRDALQKQGWSKVDKMGKDAVFRALLSSLSKQAYVTLPMSELMMFGRSQDYGFAQGDPLRVIASRHHFRIWKAPFQVGSSEVWVGAGTHDIGFDKDQRNNKITHKIDPDTDLEREYITNSFAESGLVTLKEARAFTDPIKLAKTAHGEEFRSDGNTNVIYFASDNSDSSRSFGDYFCSVLTKNPDGGDWGDCSQYLSEAGKTNLPLPAPSPDYRVLIVPGFMSSCFPESPAFQEGQEALKKYGFNVSLYPVPNNKSEDNAKELADYLRTEGPKDTKKFILVGYSKGTPDLQVMLAKEKGVQQYVAAFVSVAGASGGSAIADIVPGMADQYIKQYFKMQNCKGDLAEGFKSLQRAARQAFLGAYPNPIVPTYSVIAFSNKDNTSKSLMQTWNMLQGYDTMIDGQLTRQDATIPGSKFLGSAKSDHFALALPFDKSTDKTIRTGMDKTRYPRGALLESMIRFVMDDLKAK